MSCPVRAFRAQGVNHIRPIETQIKSCVHPLNIMCILLLLGPSLHD